MMEREECRGMYMLVMALWWICDIMLNEISLSILCRFL
jgi:hypothetical protein